MPPELFRALFTDGSIAREAVELAKQSTFSRQALKDAADGVVQLSDCDVRSVWLAVQDDDAVENLFAHCRIQLSAKDSAKFVWDAVRHVLDQKGRRFVSVTRGTTTGGCVDQGKLAAWTRMRVYPC